VVLAYAFGSIAECVIENSICPAATFLAAPTNGASCRGSSPEASKPQWIPSSMRIASMFCRPCCTLLHLQDRRDRAVARAPSGERDPAQARLLDAAIPHGAVDRLEKLLQAARDRIDLLVRSGADSEIDHDLT